MIFCATDSNALLFYLRCYSLIILPFNVCGVTFPIGRGPVTLRPDSIGLPSINLPGRCDGCRRSNLHASLSRLKIGSSAGAPLPSTGISSKTSNWARRILFIHNEAKKENRYENQSTWGCQTANLVRGVRDIPVHEDRFSLGCCHCNYSLQQIAAAKGTGKPFYQ